MLLSSAAPVTAPIRHPYCVLVLYRHKWSQTNKQASRHSKARPNQQRFLKYNIWVFLLWLSRTTSSAPNVGHLNGTLGAHMWRCCCSTRCEVPGFTSEGGETCAAPPFQNCWGLSYVLSPLLHDFIFFFLTFCLCTQSCSLVPIYRDLWGAYLS